MAGDEADCNLLSDCEKDLSNKKGNVDDSKENNTLLVGAISRANNGSKQS